MASFQLHSCLHLLFDVQLLTVLMLPRSATRAMDAVHLPGTDQVDTSMLPRAESQPCTQLLPFLLSLLF